jgi:hypothetical protein
LGCQEDVIKLDVTVEDTLGVDVTDASYDLCEQKFGDVFLEFASLANICEEITAATDLHDEDDVLNGLKRFIETDNITVTRVSQDVELLHDLALRRIILHHRLVYRLERYELRRKTVNCKVHFPEGTLTHDFADFIPLDLSLRRLASLQERYTDLLLDLGNNAGPRGQLL